MGSPCGKLDWLDTKLAGQLIGASAGSVSNDNPSVMIAALFGPQQHPTSLQLAAQTVILQRCY